MSSTSSSALEPEERGRRWIALFDALFSPLEVRPGEDGSSPAVTLREDGVVMEVPAVTSLPALVSSWRGRGLFGARHAQLVTSLRQLAEHAENARDAFDRGAREERARVARDLHDDVGATLTSGLYQEDPARMRQAVQSAILEMRSMVNVLSGRRLGLSDVVGDLRHETLQRLGDAKIAPSWPLSEFGARTVHSTIARNWGSMMRELTTNVLRHAKAGTMRVSVELVGDRLVTTLRDDGVGFDGELGATACNLHRRPGIGAVLTFTRGDPGPGAPRRPLDPDRPPSRG